ncbi:MAG: mevalonate kinase [Anaerolineales bacterium]|nr:mevalonate kinase [Anaerolineales bacterium]
MAVTVASAPGKIILFGEHAVVYGQPAIAVPVTAVQAKARVQPDISAPSSRILVWAEQIGLDAALDELPIDNPLAAAVRAALVALGVPRPPAFRLHVSSTIPLAGGMGSGAAVSVAIVRAVSDFVGRPLADEQVNQIAFEVEKLHHGTPSGIDNTVVTYAQPVYFVKGRPVERLEVRRPLHWLIADSGLPAPTAETVGDVRRGWQADPGRYETLFSEIGLLARQAREALAAGDMAELGRLMNANQALLQQLDVSSATLDALTTAALAAGAAGAKLSGGGRGGNVIALVDEPQAAQVREALLAAGAKTIIDTRLTRPRVE